MSKRSLAVVVFIFFTSISLVAQVEEPYIFGKLVDSQTKGPVVFATVRLKNKSLGVITDKNGGFRIPTDFLIQGDVLEISCMGYGSKEVVLSSLATDKVNIIMMDTAVFTLNETTVTAELKYLSAETIVQYAINNIKNNYPQEPYRYLGYYRDYQLKQDNYVNLNEALIEVWDNGFQSIDTILTNFLLHDYRKNVAFEIDSFASKPYDYTNKDKVVPSASFGSPVSNEFMLLRIHNPIRNHRTNTFSYIYRLPKDFIKNHILLLKGTTVYSNKEVYEIEIFRETLGFTVTGRIFIDKANFAIRKLDYGVKQFPIRNQDLGFSDQVKLPSTEDGNTLFDINIEYQEAGEAEKMYLNYISFRNRFKIIRPGAFKMENLTVDRSNRHIEVVFNNSLAKDQLLRPSFFRLHYLGKEIPVVQVTRKTEKSVLLKLGNPRTEEKLVNRLFSHIFNPERDALELKMRRIKDSEGNLLDKRKEEMLDQFREFFTQEVILSKKDRVGKENFMLKNRALSDPKQPMFVSDSTRRYWMNTPLKAIR
ncbi:MAG: carboxypeptidase-like regulatory domain-containing protein [Bacteroidota bacterium]